MDAKLGVVLTIFLLVVGVASAETLQDQADAAVQASVDQANRYLTAEVSRQMTAEKEQLSTELKRYQDENFAILDQRMQNFLSDTKNAVVIGSIGAAALANAIVGMALLIFMRKYSYEGYLKGLLERQGKQILELQDLKASDAKRDLQGIMEMQAESRQEQVPTNTIGMQYGQVAAGRMSEMNQWQNIPAYQGAWAPPGENVRQELSPRWDPVYSHPSPQYPPEQQFDPSMQYDPSMMNGGYPQ